MFRDGAQDHTLDRPSFALDPAAAIPDLIPIRRNYSITVEAGMLTLIGSRFSLTRLPQLSAWRCTDQCRQRCWPGSSMQRARLAFAVVICACSNRTAVVRTRSPDGAGGAER